MDREWVKTITLSSRGGGVEFSRQLGLWPIFAVLREIHGSYILLAICHIIAHAQYRQRGRTTPLYTTVELDETADLLLELTIETCNTSASHKDRRHVELVKPETRV